MRKAKQDTVFAVDFKVFVLPFQFLRAEVANVENPPMALIRYELNGHEPETGLRLDLDKQAFLDHFEDGSEEEQALQIALPILINIVCGVLDIRQGLPPKLSYFLPPQEFVFRDDSPVIGERESENRLDRFDRLVQRLRSRDPNNLSYEAIEELIEATLQEDRIGEGLSWGDPRFEPEGVREEPA